MTRVYLRAVGVHLTTVGLAMPYGFLIQGLVYEGALVYGVGRFTAHLVASIVNFSCMFLATGRMLDWFAAMARRQQTERMMAEILKGLQDEVDALDAGGVRINEKGVPLD